MPLNYLIFYRQNLLKNQFIRRIYRDMCIYKLLETPCEMKKSMFFFTLDQNYLNSSLLSKVLHFTLKTPIVKVETQTKKLIII